VGSGTILETALRRDRLIVAAGLAGAIALAWAYIAPTAIDMHGSMSGLAAWMMAASWDARYFVLIFLMWCVMMLGMMLPSAAPTILLYALVQRRSQSHPRIALAYVFAAGYLAAWIAFSLAATTVQWLLAAAALLSPMMEAASTTLGAALLIAAGVYQWLPAKRVCLTHCRSPLEWLPRNWRPGAGGALRMGIAHGAYCLGCCWALMLLLFVGGVMNLVWIALLTTFVLLEKLAPRGDLVGRVGGVALVAAGVWLLAD
jgi:predicted metal-binding membrane protein